MAMTTESDDRLYDKFVSALSFMIYLPFVVVIISSECAT